MDKQSFLAQLSASLRQLPEPERSRFLDYYAEIIDDRVEEGMTEEQAVAGLEDAQETARAILLEQPLGTLVKTRVAPKAPSAGGSALRTVLLILGFPVWFPILAAVLAVVLSVYLVIWTLVACVFIVDAAIGLSGLVCVLSTLVLLKNPIAAVAALGCGFVLAGLAALLFFPAKAAASGLIRLTGAMARGIKSLFIRRETHE